MGLRVEAARDSMMTMSEICNIGSRPHNPGIRGQPLLPPEPEVESGLQSTYKAVAPLTALAITIILGNSVNGNQVEKVIILRGTGGAPPCQISPV